MLGRQGTVLCLLSFAQRETENRPLSPAAYSREKNTSELYDRESYVYQKCIYIRLK